MKPLFHFLALAAFLLPVLATDAGEMKAKLDHTVKPKFLEKYFKDYGQGPEKMLHVESPVALFWCDPAAKDAKQIGLYSYFTLTGDFEIAVNYEWKTTQEPKTGYGVSCGIAVEAEGKKVSLARGFQIGTGNAYLVTEMVGKDYKTEPTTTDLKKGMLVLRRKKAVITCLATGSDGSLEEIRDKIPFTAASVRKVRLFADPGGAPNALEAQLIDLRIQADEILSDIPEYERNSRLWWWLTAGGLILVVAAGYYGYRRWQRN
jgi:hypothetical protein